MKRREFVAGVGASILTASRALAQNRARIGWLTSRLTRVSERSWTACAGLGGLRPTPLSSSTHTRRVGRNALSISRTPWHAAGLSSLWPLVRTRSLQRALL